MRLGLAIAFALAIVVGPTARAMAQSSAIIYSAFINDGGFNQLASDGLQRFTRTHSVTVRTAVAQDSGSSIERLEAFIANGVTHIIAIGFVNADAVAAVAPKHPAVKFTVVDAVVDLPNVASIVFAEDEVAYLAGIAAALSPGVDAVGAVGGLPIQPIRRFMSGFCQGARSISPSIRVVFRYIGTDSRAFRDREGAARLTDELIADGVDVVFAVAGQAGLGVHEAAMRAQVLSVGVDVNENGRFPGTILTSAVKRVDVAVYSYLVAAQIGRWEPGLVTLGLADDAVGLARDAHNEARLSAMADQLDRIEASLRARSIRIAPPDGAGECRPQ